MYSLLLRTPLSYGRHVQHVRREPQRSHVMTVAPSNVQINSCMEGNSVTSANFLLDLKKSLTLHVMEIR